MKQAIADMTKHPICAIHGTFLLILAIKSSIPTLFSGSWDAAMVDLTMAAVLLFVISSQPYAAVFAFVLLAIKAFMRIKRQ